MNALWRAIYAFRDSPVGAAPDHAKIAAIDAAIKDLRDEAALEERAETVRYLRNAAGSWVAANEGRDLIIAAEAIKSADHRKGSL